MNLKSLNNTLAVLKWETRKMDDGTKAVSLSWVIKLGLGAPFQQRSCSIANTFLKRRELESQNLSSPRVVVAIDICRGIVYRIFGELRCELGMSCAYSFYNTGEGIMARGDEEALTACFWDFDGLNVSGREISNVNKQE